MPKGYSNKRNMDDIDREAEREGKAMNNAYPYKVGRPSKYKKVRKLANDNPQRLRNKPGKTYNPAYIFGGFNG